MSSIILGVKIVELYWVIHKCDAFGPDMMRQVSNDVKQLLYVEKKFGPRGKSGMVSQAPCTGLGITPQCAVARGAQAHAFEGLIERNPPSHTLSPSARLPPRYGM